MMEKFFDSKAVLVISVLLAIVSASGAIWTVSNMMNGQSTSSSSNSLFKKTKNTTTSTQESQQTNVTLTSSGAVDGYTLLMPISGNYIYLIDMNGNEAHSWKLPGNPGHSAYLLPDGRLLATYGVRSQYFTGTGISGGGIEILDWDGNVVWKYEMPDDGKYHTHHDVAYMQNGHILAISYERFTKDEAIALGFDSSRVNKVGEIWAEVVFEIDPSTNKIVWEWHVKDHLGKGKTKFDPTYTIGDNPVSSGTDWLHFNAIDYNEALDQIIFSSRNLSEFYIIDHNTTRQTAAGNAGDILFRYGNPQTYGGNAAQTLSGQHNVHWIDPTSKDSNILIFNNNDRKVGRSNIVELDLNSSYTNADIVWQYGDDANEETFFSDHIAGAQRLANGNTLICVGTEGYVFEIDSTGKVVWNWQNTKFGGTTPRGDSVALFRAERYPTSYSGLKF